MTLLLTGGAGFIGSHILDLALASGRSVVVVDSFNEHLYPSSIKRKNLELAESSANFRLEEVDVRDTDRLREICERHTVLDIVHLAALAGVRHSIDHALDYVDVNVRGTASVLSAAVATGVRRVVIASSSSVYGKHAAPPFREDAHLDAAANPYAASKAAMETVAESMAIAHGLAITCLRYFTVYGPRQRPDMAAHTFLRHAIAGKAIPVYGDGTTARDYTFVRDAAQATLDSLSATRGFSTYNIGGGEVVELSEFIAALRRVSGLEIATRHLELPRADMPLTVSDCTAATRDFGYRPSVGLDEGLEQMWEWFRSPERLT